MNHDENHDENHLESGRKSLLHAAMKRGCETREAEANAAEGIERLVEAGTDDEAQISALLEETSEDFQNGFRLGLLAGAQRATRS